MDGIAWAGSAMVAARTRLEIATENLANASTDGFARLIARGSLSRDGARVTPSVDTSARGALRHTGRDLDLAVVGPGAFIVAGGDGRHSTRAGSFVRERDGTLRDAAGGSVIARLELPPGASVRSGFLESASVDAIHEMIDVLSAERSFESAQKVVSSIDRTREKASTDVARVT